MLDRKRDAEGLMLDKEQDAEGDSHKKERVDVKKCGLG
jgi:hypothetical protein